MSVKTSILKNYLRFQEVQENYSIEERNFIREEFAKELNNKRKTIIEASSDDFEKRIGL